MATPSSIADIGRAFDIGSSRGGFATNMPTYPTGYGAPYAPKDPYSTSLLSPDDMGQFRSMFDLWGNRIGQSIGSMAAPFNEFSGRFKTFEDYLREIRDSLKTPTGGTPAPAPPVQPPAPAGIAPPTPAGTLPDLTNPLNTVGNLVVNAGNILTDLPVGGVGPGVTAIEDTVGGAIRPEDLFVPGPPGVAGFVDFGGGIGMDENGQMYRHTGTEWVVASDTVLAGPGGEGLDATWVDPRITDRQVELDLITDLDPIDTPQPGDTAVDATTGLPIIFGADGQWTWANGPTGVGPPPGYMVNPEGEIVAGGAPAPEDDTVVDPTTGPIDTTGLGQTIVTLGQGLDAAGNVINLVSGIQNEDPTQSIAGLIGLVGNPAVLKALDIPNVVPGTGTGSPQPMPGFEGGDQGGVSLTGASAVAGGLLVMGSSLASDAPDEQKALQASAGAAQAVGGVAQIMKMEGVSAAMAAVRLALGIVANTFTDKPAEQQAVEAALDTVSAAAVFMGPWGAVVMMAAQVVKIAVTKLWHPDTPHRVREALETSNVGRVVSTAISAIEQAETADELHAVATQGNFGENDWIVNIPMSAGADPRETLDLLSGDPTANVQAGVLDQFKEPMNRAVAGMLKRQAGLIRAAETFTANSPTPGRQYLASDVDYFMRNIERFDGEPYDALDAAQVERVVGQHLMEVFRRQGGGWYGPWLDPNLVYNQQGIDEPLRRRGVSEEDIEAARQLFAAKAPGLTEVQYSQDPAQAMAELTGLPVRTTRYFVQGAAGPSSTTEAAAEPIVAQPDGETGTETEEQIANRLYEASIAPQLTD